MTLTSDRPIFRLVRPAAAAVVSLLLVAGCSGGGGAEEAEDLSSGAIPSDTSNAAPNDSGDGSESEGSEVELVAPQRLLPAESDVADGFVEVPAECTDPEGYAATVAFAVPDGWKATGRGQSGESVDLTFSTPDGDVEIEFDDDSVAPDGTISVDGEPFESFDYDYETFSSSGDGGSGTITFESVADVSVGDQEVELWVADPDQDPEFLSTTEYKARVRTANLTNPGAEGGLTPASMVVSVTHDAASTDISTEDVEGIVAGLALPDCAWDQEVAQLELSLGEDLDGDGEVATAQDLYGG